HVPVAAVAVADREQRVDALGERLADAEEEPGREGDAKRARLLEHAEPEGGLLVGRPLMHLPTLAQPRGDGLEPEAQADGDLPRPCHLVAREEAGVGGGQEAGVEGDPTRALDEVDGRTGAHPGERLAVLAIGELGAIPETNEALGATERGATPRPFGDLLRR